MPLIPYVPFSPVPAEKMSAPLARLSVSRPPEPLPRVSPCHAFCRLRPCPYSLLKRKSFRHGARPSRAKSPPGQNPAGRDTPEKGRRGRVNINLALVISPGAGNMPAAGQLPPILPLALVKKGACVTNQGVGFSGPNHHARISLKTSRNIYNGVMPAGFSWVCPGSRGQVPGRVLCPPGARRRKHAGSRPAPPDNPLPWIKTALVWQMRAPVLAS